ncbi:hypothetical protein Tco_0643491 [Tanacetum coccineum]
MVRRFNSIITNGTRHILNVNTSTRNVDSRKSAIGVYPLADYVLVYGASSASEGVELCVKTGMGIGEKAIVNGGQKIYTRCRKISERQKLWDKAEVIKLLLEFDLELLNGIVVDVLPSLDANGKGRVALAEETNEPKPFRHSFEDDKSRFEAGGGGGERGGGEEEERGKREKEKGKKGDREGEGGEGGEREGGEGGGERGRGEEGTGGHEEGGDGKAGGKGGGPGGKRAERGAIGAEKEERGGRIEESWEGGEARRRR